MLLGFDSRGVLMNMRDAVRRVRRSRFGKGLLVVYRKANGRLDCFGFNSPERAQAFAARCGERLRCVL